MLEQIRKFASPTRRNEEGASAVEYGLLVALIAAVVVVAVVALGGLVKSTFNDTCESIGAERSRRRPAHCDDCATTADRSSSRLVASGGWASHGCPTRPLSYLGGQR